MQIDWLQTLVVLVSAAQLPRLFMVHRKTVRDHVDRTEVGRNGPRRHAWGWGEPPPDLDLTVDDGESSSTVTLAQRGRTSVEVAGCLLGYTLLGVAGHGLVTSLFRESLLPRFQLVFFVVLCGLGWTLLNTHATTRHIRLTPHTLTFVVRYGLFFYRPVRYKRRRLRFRHRLQSVFGMETAQDLPEVYLWVRRWFLERRFIFAASPDAVTWILGGLEAWRDHEQA